MSSNNELLEALNVIEKEKSIPKETLLEAIENSLLTACKNHFGKSDNIKVNINPETCEYHVFQEKTVVETVADSCTEISLANAKMEDSKYEIGDIVNSTGEIFKAIFSEDAMGRITDIFGRDQLSGKPFANFKYIDIEKPNVPIIDRTAVCRPLLTGIASKT